MASTSPIISSDSLHAVFAASRAAGRAALIPYITAGYPDQADTLPLLRALSAAGADIIELGVPFSDPVADGPTIQRSSQRALDQGTTMEWTLSVLASFRREQETPVVIFTYLNPLLAFGLERFVDRAVRAGAQGVLVVDLPVGADERIEATLESSPLALIRLLAPTTPAERRREIARRTQAFLYYVARLGVTGARADLREALAEELQDLRNHTNVPLAVGFGISTPNQARAAARLADGVVVGSALIDCLDRSGIDAARNWLLSLRQAMDAD
jgi:tryptophan synthase alpha chain